MCWGVFENVCVGGCLRMYVFEDVCWEMYEEV